MKYTCLFVMCDYGKVLTQVEEDVERIDCDATILENSLKINTNIQHSS